MSGMLKITVRVLFLSLCLVAGAALATEGVNSRTTAEPDRDESWYYRQPTYQPDTRAIIHQKAQVRAYQRQARLASLSWYGMYNARPTAAPTPFTSLYSPVWQMPGGQPFAWYAYNRPTYVIYTR